MAKTDEELMLAYQGGDLEAFTQLYQRNSSKLFGYLRKKIGNAADDVFQLVFLKLHRTRSQYDPKYLFEQWLFVIARSVLLDYLKQERRLSQGLKIDSEAEVEKIADPSSQGEVPSAYSEVDGMLDSGSLSEEQGEVVKLRVLDDLTYGEIAERLKRSEMSVRQLFSRAMRKLRGTHTLKAEPKRGEQ
jgi:RNA polymerase sigma-70 factor (ECF subfamily)